MSSRSNVITATFTVIAIAVLVQGSAGDPHRPGPSFPHRVQMDQLGHYVMSWESRETDIEIILEVATHGYVGLGFSPTGGMKGADIILGWVDEAGVAHLSDRYAIGEKTPEIDPSQDVELISGTRNDTHTILRFRRPWRTCDERHDFEIKSDTTRVIWAYDSLAPVSPTSTTLPRHDHRGTRSLYLKAGTADSLLKLTPDMRHWDVLAPNVSLPNDANTLYWCNLYKVPPMRQKTHFIGYQPLIPRHMLPHVHHMILYECHITNSSEHLEQWVVEHGAQCYMRNMPTSWDACGSPIVAWAVGSDGYFLPDHVGFPLGEEHGGATYFLLETHYNNPDYVKDLFDNSGLRLYYTETLRQHDAGVLQIGHSVDPFQIIPAGRVWTSNGHCTADCTRHMLPKSGIHIFSGLLHAHLLGRAIRLQHIRYGTELPLIIADDNYDFDYQQERRVTPERTVLPGDHLIASCTYDATHRHTTTYGGMKTTSEMCLVFASYYPRQQFSECYSRPDIAMVLDTLGVQDMADNNAVQSSFKIESFDPGSINPEWESKRMKAMQGVGAGQNYQDSELSSYMASFVIAAPPELSGTRLLTFLNNRTLWQREAMVRTLQERVLRGQYEPFCVARGRQIPDTLPKRGKYPPYIPYKPPNENCTTYGTVKITFPVASRSPTMTSPPSEPRRKDTPIGGTVQHRPEYSVGVPLPDTDVVEIALHKNLVEDIAQEGIRNGIDGNETRPSRGFLQGPAIPEDHKDKLHNLRSSSESRGSASGFHPYTYSLLYLIIIAFLVK